MNKIDRPILGLETEFQIETERNHFHAFYWPQLEKMLVSTPKANEVLTKIWPMIHRQPPAPERPQALRLLLANYASAPFDREATCYPNDPQLLYWLQKLAQRTISTVLGAVAQMEKNGSTQGLSLSHHGLSQQDMQAAMSAALDKQTEARLVVAATAAIKERLSNPPAKTPAASKQSASEDAPIKQQIEALRNECRLTVEELAEALDLNPRSVYRHLSGDAIPRNRQIAAYEKFFSKKLSKEVRLKTSVKRQ